ncbi:SDR family oxidoreductase [Rhodococcus sp. T2V]|uniref:SDR family NAD(P)-dependent oxidoreductase n=1 Tax=Rhodococcus sp. T2V TaxID=3034164 RepID=UPI0023E30D73|nr:SDR family oxidoreductase [Rhodococcus sp. T2V]MDF3306198.1 SDR family oxidoreductase [Rhodococcus sp. T2V]
MGQLLEGKTVIITGAGGGIGLATALHLHDEGAQVVATVHSEASLPQLKVDDDRLIAKVVDVTDEEQVKGIVDFTVQTFGKLDGIVNNAGVLKPGTILDASVEDFQKTFDVNVKGVFLGTKYAIPELLKAGGGSIVNFGSINSIGAEKLLTTYTASKGAVLTLTKAVALDFGAQGIRANTLCPGFVDTPLNVPHYTALGGRDELEAGLPDFQPIGRAILPIEIAHSVAFLLSDHSTAITGTAFVVDGGVLAGA